MGRPVGGLLRLLLSTIPLFFCFCSRPVRDRFRMACSSSSSLVLFLSRGFGYIATSHDALAMLPLCVFGLESFEYSGLGIHLFLGMTMTEA